MRKQIKILKKAAALFIVLMLLCSTVAVGLTASAAISPINANNEKTYEIAVVFDNSGSMYGDVAKNTEGNVRGKKAWSQAKYAMEIFASMLDFPKDKLTVFPMWAVTTDKNSKPSWDGIEIDSKEEINNIHNMYTMSPHETPFEAVTNAAEHLLKNSKADEKWLIVLTDGEFTQKVRKLPQEEKEMTSEEKAANKPDEKFVVDELNKIVRQGINVQYLGFDEASDFNSSENVTINFSCKTTGLGKGELEKALIEICNAIFERSALSDEYMEKDEEGYELELDVSMKNLIVFVQGKGAEIKSLYDDSGKEIEPSFDSGQITNSTISAGTLTIDDIDYDFSKAVSDEELAGRVVTFGACAAGEYTLDCSANNIQIFYEPDIDVKVELINNKGDVIEPSGGEMLEGDYIIKTSIIDSVTKEDVTESELLKVEKLVTSYKTSEEAEYTTYSEYGGKEGERITFGADENIFIKIEGKYLKNYNFETKDDKSFSWKFIMQPVNFKLDATVLQEKNTYVHMSDDEWDPIKVVFSLEGQPLTAEELANVKLDLRFNSELKYRTEMKESESACYIYIDENKSESLKPVGEYELTVSAEYTNERGRATPAGDEVEFKLQEIEKWIIDLLWLLIVLAVITVITLWLIHPVLPKKVIISEGNFTKNATIKGNFNMPSRYDMRCVPVSGKARVVAKSRNFWIMSKLKPKRMTFRITDVHTSGVGEFTCDGITYTCESGALYDSAGEKVESMIIGNSSVSWDENNGGYFEGSLHINKR